MYTFHAMHVRMACMYVSKYVVCMHVCDVCMYDMLACVACMCVMYVGLLSMSVCTVCRGVTHVCV